ncbi:hypothetical protein [Mesorhizobium sp.]|uniref:hypothetical protein n=1 Tax=Mesorhizobium sp. TaxID=1871066 RepID=UPI000FE45B1B|nr:hypothetical protein [Mesorhizobium sp.]RWO22840.1 MAG: hypothetical protein EOS09_19420 [Mesorhizobium sp.]
MKHTAATDLNAAIRIHQAADYIPEPAEETEHYPCLLCVWIAAAAIAWAAAIGVAYALYQAWQAIAG